MEEAKLVYSTEWHKNKKKYSLSLTEDEWNEIITLVWLEHDFKFADKLKKKLLNKYPNEINLY